MNRKRVGSILAVLASLGFFATAVLHGTGYNSVTKLAKLAPTDLQALVPALWIAFGFNLAIVGLIVGVVALRPGNAARLILVIAAICPVGAAGLQIWFLGFIAPTGILLGVGGLTLIASAALPPDAGAGL